jgi:hypothetical protein
LASGALVVGAVAPASAALPGAGTFLGAETAPPSTPYPPLNVTPLCAKFDPSITNPASPLVEQITFIGTFNGTTLAAPGAATFTSTNAAYDASPLGTFAPNTNCNAATLGYHVPGTMVAAVGAIACSGAAYYSRIQSAVEMQFVDPGGCGGAVAGALVMTFTGAEVPCLPLPCNPGFPYPPGPDAILQGTYVQT